MSSTVDPLIKERKEENWVNIEIAVGLVVTEKVGKWRKRQGRK